MSNLLAGSISADVFNGGAGTFTSSVSGATVQGDVFGTNGGTGTTFGVNLAAGHILNQIDIYGTDGTLNLIGGVVGSPINYFPLAGSITDINDNYQPGWAGLTSISRPRLKWYSTRLALAMPPDHVKYEVTAENGEVAIYDVTPSMVKSITR